MATPEENIIELKGEFKISKGQLKEVTNEFKKQQGLYNNDRKYVK